VLYEDLQSEHCGFTATTLIDRDALRLYDQVWGAVDPWAHSPNNSLLSHRRVIVGDELIAHRDVQRTAYYQDFARHFDVVRALIGVLHTSARTLSVVSISGSDGRAPFGADDVALLEPLIPHIGRALQLHQRLLAAASAVDDFQSALDYLPTALFLVDVAGRVLFMNRVASRLTATGDGLTVEHGELRAARAAERTRLRSIVADAVKTSSGAGFSAGGSLAIGRPSGRRPFVLLACPMPRRRIGSPGIEAAAAMLFVTDPEQSGAPDEDVLRALFGLTRAEAEMTRLLAQGASLTDAGAQLGVRRDKYPPPSRVGQAGPDGHAQSVRARNRTLMRREPTFWPSRRNRRRAPTILFAILLVLGTVPTATQSPTDEQVRCHPQARRGLMQKQTRSG
jgi:PAS domain-containing protein